MFFTQFTQKTKDEVLSVLKTDSTSGLSKTEAEKRLKQYGRNEVRGERISAGKIFFRQFASPFIYLLFSAAGITIFLREFIDALLILLFVAINTILGFYQEYRSEETARILKRYVFRRARVVRDGKETVVESHLVVPGDIIILEKGDVVQADARIFESSEFFVDESLLTGESVPAPKESRPQKTMARELYQTKNIVFSGTSVVRGRGRGVVFATGKNAVVGEIGMLASATKRESDFEKNIKSFSVFILKVVVVTLSAMVFLHIVLKGWRTDIFELLVFAIALAVSVIPEALPLVTTFSLSLGARKLAQKKVIVKRLSAIEDLGGIEVLCTDKTGTLTENEQKVARVIAKDVDETLVLAAAASGSVSSNTRELNNSFDLALSRALSKKQEKDIHNIQRIQEFPFDPELRQNAVFLKRNNRVEFVLRGAPEEVFKRCVLSEEELKKYNRAVIEEGKIGRRVLAIARHIFQNEKDAKVDSEKLQCDFLGIIAFLDPLKKTAKEAVLLAEKSGVAIKILTGDSPEVSGAVAREVGLIQSLGEVILGESFDKMSHRKQKEVLEKCRVFARVSPKQKYRIIELLRETKTVGFLGEGINDAPALKIANVGVAVSDASDIARESADILLVKKNLLFLIDGIREGRKVFSNTVKYIKATLASNFGNFYAVAIASFLVDFLPMLPLQILLVNLLSDFPMIAIATDRVALEEIKKPQKYRMRDIAFTATILGVVSTFFDFIFFALFSGISAGVLQTNWFIGSIITEILFLFSIRAKGIFFRAPRPSFSIILLSLAAVFFTFLLPLTWWGAETFRLAPPSAQHIMVIFIVAGLYFICTEAAKLFMHSFFRQEKKLE